ncbi:hypothetical protein GCM10017056_13290 [Seohaeicola zhoushanensis]|uniref:Uncharacterized protein n=1 Tax=Seohaeicola zhoushanensis TaxID=1569283 RepID=A0A8J3GVD6_9RHOB|nr:hypothetical protein GCM10017056_13290 [Seohaeicola zhoushanensis]
MRAINTPFGPGEVTSSVTARTNAAISAQFMPQPPRRPAATMPPGLREGKGTCGQPYPIAAIGGSASAGRGLT